MKPGEHKTEACYKVEYALRQEIHSKIGEILKLEHINAKHCREIERLNKEMKNLESELVIRDIPRMKESLKSSARLAIKQDDEIDTLEAELLACKKEIGVLNDRIIDKALESQKLRVELFTFKEDLFEYLKGLLIELSHKEGNTPINPDDIDVKYIEAASRYCYPVLFDKYAVLDQDDTTKLKIQFAEYILRMFGLENMYEYENLHTRGEIELEFIDHRSDADENAEDRHKIEFADSILNKFGIETMAKYEELVERGDIDIATVDNRIPSKDVGYGTVRKYR